MIEQYLEYMENVKGKSSNTIDAYRNDLEIFNSFLESKFKCKAVTINVIKKVDIVVLHAYISYLSKVRKNGNKAKARKIASLKSYFKYLCNTIKVIPDNPTLELETPKQESRLPIHLSLEQANELLSVVAGTAKERDYCILTLFLNCGMRLSELISIDVESIKGDTLTVIGKGNKERTIYLNDMCLKAISEYLNVRPNVGDRALFLSNRKMRISKKAVQYMLHKYIINANLNSKVSPHKLRHTSATLMYQYGNVDIRALKEILGHESVATTQIYTHINQEQLRTAVKNNPLNVK